jgi:hypothetical protein
MPEDVVLTSTNFHRVVPDRPVVLSILTGEGQVSGTALLLNGEPRPFNSPGGPQELGRGEALIGSFLHAKTTVRDVNPMTNRTSVTYVFDDGVEATEYPYSIEVSAEHGAAHYLVAFLFTASELD